MELKLAKPINELIPKLIAFNAEEIKTGVKNLLANYKDNVYTEATIVQAKSDRAYLNRIRKSLSDERIRIKKEYLEPYESFESQIKEIDLMISEANDNIDTQIKEYEEEAKENKRAEIEAIFIEQSTSKGLGTLITLDKLWSDKWLNKGYKIDKIEAEIAESMNNANQAIKTITSLNTEYEKQLTDYYFNCLDITATLAEKVRLEQVAESHRIVLERARASSKANIRQTEEKPQDKQPGKELEQIDFRVWVTAEQKALIRDFLLDNNIKYGKVE